MTEIYSAQNSSTQRLLHILHSPLVECPAIKTQSDLLIMSPTSKGSAVALATPWKSLEVGLEPLLMCGPAPRTCCSTEKAIASSVPTAAPSDTTTECTRLDPFCTRTSPREKKERKQGETSLEFRKFPRKMTFNAWGANPLLADSGHLSPSGIRVLPPRY